MVRLTGGKAAQTRITGEVGGVAHHEPIFHLNLVVAQQQIRDACLLLCPPTAYLMDGTSTLQAEVTNLTQFTAGLNAPAPAQVVPAAPVKI